MARVNRLEAQLAWGPLLVTRRRALDQLLLGVLLAALWAALWSGLVIDLEARSAAAAGTGRPVVAAIAEAPSHG
jgi:ferric-dicitrate binding protein FerR (iron transport regulator)